jgi:hypothetical protein
MAACGFPGFEGAAFNHVLNGAERDTKPLGSLSGTEEFGVGHGV